jgi:hypothetical protein
VSTIPASSRSISLPSIYPGLHPPCLSLSLDNCNIFTVSVGYLCVCVQLGSNPWPLGLLDKRSTTRVMPPSHFAYILFLRYFPTNSAQADLEFMIFPPLSSWDYRHVPSCLFMSMDLSFPQCHKVGIMQFVAFSDWLHSLSHATLWFFVCFHGWMFFSAEYYSTGWMCHGLLHPLKGVMITS